MRKPSIVVLWIVSSLLLLSCSPRDFLGRRLAADLIAGSATFRASQQFQLRIGIVPNETYISTDYVALQHRGWISAAHVNCPKEIASSPCWNVTLTPSGVDTFQSLITPGDAEKQSFTFPAARRGLVSVTGISKQANVASVEFTWRWIPLNEVGAVLYSSDARYRSTASFRLYDDGWRILQSAPHSGQPLDEALKNADPAP
jgi:hypothetical protein